MQRESRAKARVDRQSKSIFRARCVVPMWPPLSAVALSLTASTSAVTMEQYGLDVESKTVKSHIAAAIKKGCESAQFEMPDGAWTGVERSSRAGGGDSYGEI